MISATTKIGAFAPYVSATSQIVASQLRPAVIALSASQKVPFPSRPKTLSHHSLCALLPKSPSLKVTSGVHGAGSVRFAHTDIQVPDFSDYRKDQSMQPDQRAADGDVSKRSFTYMVVGAGGLVAAYSAKSMVVDFLSTMSASADVLALASVEINLGDIPEGKNLTLKWRGKPLFVRHRTESEIAEVADVDLNSLRDPQHDKDRVQRPEWLVLIGVCTHLGCVPIANAGEFNGYFCPCHGSHYDISGRIRKGPAPLNLEVPEYRFDGEDILVVG